MEIEALNKICDLAIQAGGHHVLSEHTPALVLGDEVVSIEHLKEGRSRFRGKMRTALLSEYVAYVKRYPNGSVFIDADDMGAIAFLNLGTPDSPGHADWRAELKLKATAAFRAVNAIDGKAMSQKQMAEWIEDWQSAGLSAMVNDEPISITHALTAIREITIEAKKNVTTTDRDFGASRSALEEIEAKSKIRLPTHICFRCVPYLGFQAQVITLRLSVIAGDTPALKPRIVGGEQLQENLAHEFKELLLTEIGESADLTIGTFAP